MTAMGQGNPSGAWYPDPSGRHEQRYWSGSAWTEHVADRGQQFVDPPPPAAVPPGAVPPGGAGWATGAPGGRIGQPADLLPRFAARLIDFILVGIVTGILSSVVVVGALIGSHASIFSTWGVGRSTSYLANAVSSAVSAIITLGYFTLMEANLGQTLGKMILRLRTQGPDGARPTLEQALKRNAFTAIPILGLVPVLGWL